MFVRSCTVQDMLVTLIIIVRKQFGHQHVMQSLVVAYVDRLHNLVDGVITCHHMAAPRVILCIL